MASPVTLANVYTCIWHYRNDTDTLETWRQGMDFFSTTIPADHTYPIIAALSNWFQRNLHSGAHIEEIELRNWTRGDIPFSQEGALWRDLVNLPNLKQDGTVGAGLYGSEGPNPFGKEVVGLFDKQQVGSGGRKGRMFIRGLLDDHDAIAGTGVPWSIKSGAVVNNAAVAAWVPVHLGTWLGAGKDPGIVVVHWDKKNVGLPFHTPCSGFAYRGPTTNKATHKSKK